jgi:hypothetical protein
MVLVFFPYCVVAAHDWVQLGGEADSHPKRTYC